MEYIIGKGLRRVKIIIESYDDPCVSRGMVKINGNFREAWKPTADIRSESATNPEYG